MGLGLEDAQQRKGICADGEGLRACLWWHIFGVQREVYMECDEGRKWLWSKELGRKSTRYALDRDFEMRTSK